MWRMTGVTPASPLYAFTGITLPVYLHTWAIMKHNEANLFYAYLSINQYTYEYVAQYQYISMSLSISISVCCSVSVYQYVALMFNLFILVTHEYFCAGFSWFHAFSSHSTRKGGSLYVTLAYRIHSSLEVIFTHAWEHNFLVCGRIPYLRYCLPKVSGTDTNYRH